jgi:hypothetical protein
MAHLLTNVVQNDSYMLLCHKTNGAVWAKMNVASTEKCYMERNSMQHTLITRVEPCASL